MKSFPKNLIITGSTSDSIQSFEDKRHLHFGIQYHPESFATEFGSQIIENFIRIVKERVNFNEIIKTIG